MKRTAVPYPAELRALLGAAAPGRRPHPLTPGEYRAQCLFRTPAFMAELRPLWTVTGQPSPEAATALADRWGLPGLFRLERQEVGALIVYDPAFSRAWWETMMRTPRRMRFWYDAETRDRISRTEFGLPWASAEKLSFADLIRRRFMQLSAAEKTKFRQQGGPAAFQQARLFVPIRAETKLEDLQRLWPILRQAQDAIYGADRPETRRRKPRGSLELRLAVWDLMEQGRVGTLREAARRLGCSVAAARRAYLAAAYDITGATPAPPRRRRPMPSPRFDPSRHVAQCPQCRRAERVADFCAEARAYADQDHTAGDSPVDPRVLDEMPPEAQERRKRRRQPPRRS